jgi:hypothetical protein
VDVELARERRTDLGRVAARAFGAAEADRLRSLAPGESERELLRLWTMREARIKCLGAEPPAGAALWTAPLELGRAAAAALATSEPPRALHRYRL